MSNPIVRAVVLEVLPGYRGNTFSMAAAKQFADVDPRFKFDELAGQVYIEIEVEHEVVQAMLKLQGTTITVPA